MPHAHRGVAVYVKENASVDLLASDRCATTDTEGALVLA